MFHILSLMPAPAKKEPWLPWPLLVNAFIKPRIELCYNMHSISVDQQTQTRNVKCVSGQDPTGKLIAQKGWVRASKQCNRAETCRVTDYFKDYYPLPFTWVTEKQKLGKSPAWTLLLWCSSQQSFPKVEEYSQKIFQLATY